MLELFESVGRHPGINWTLAPLARSSRSMAGTRLTAGQAAHAKSTFCERRYVEHIGRTDNRMLFTQLTRFQIKEPRRTIGLFIGPLAGLVIAFAPLSGMERDAHLLMGLLAFVVIYWITEALPLPVTALAGIALAVLVGIAPATTAFAAFGNDVILLFIGSFIIARAMTLHGLDRRIAFTVLSVPFAEKSPLGLVAVVAFTGWFLSMWISNTAACAMLLPVVLAVSRNMYVGRANPDGTAPGTTKYTFALLFMLAYACSVGGIATPVGTPPNLIGIALIRDLTGEDLNFLQWLRIALPMSFLLLLVAFSLLYFLYRPPLKQGGPATGFFRDERRALGAISAGERNTLLAFGVAVVLWVLPGMVGAVAGHESAQYEALRDRLPEGVVAIIAAVLLFALPTNWRIRRFTMSWDEAVKIDWGTVLLFAGGISLGGMMLDTGLANSMGTALVDSTGLTGLSGITAASVAGAVVVSEAASNTASASIVVPVMISLGVAAGIDPLVPALGATIGASLGFMLPVSTPPNALIYGTRTVSILQMVRNGILLDLFGVLALWVYLSFLLSV